LLLSADQRVLSYGSSSQRGSLPIFSVGDEFGLRGGFLHHPVGAKKISQPDISETMLESLGRMMRVIEKWQEASKVDSEARNT
jgi:hypothetical protein